MADSTSSIVVGQGKKSDYLLPYHKIESLMRKALIDQVKPAQAALRSKNHRVAKRMRDDSSDECDVV